MTAMTDLEQRLAAWLDDDGPIGVRTDVVDAALALAAGKSQRPAWLVPEWWRPRAATRPADANADTPITDRPGSVRPVGTLRVIRHWPRIAWAIIALTALLALVGGLLGAGGWLRATTVPGFACPADSNPDQPGPAAQVRPFADYGPPSEWAGGGQIFALGGFGHNWTFDVCSNTWQPAKTDPLAPGRGALAWDGGSGRLVLIGSGAMTRRPDGTWDNLGGGPQRLGAQLGYDAAADLVIIRDPQTTMMWTFDPDMNAWHDIVQVGPTPPSAGSSGFVLATYDAAAARFVLLDGAQSNRVWLFDPQTSTWVRAGLLPPALSLFIETDEIAYDPVGRRTLVYANGRVFAYEAGADRWEVLYQAGPKDVRFDRVAPGVAFDPVNERLVVIGGRVRTDVGWAPTDDVVAFDPRTRTWIELLAPSTGGSP
jgi:hypothetical protein